MEQSEPEVQPGEKPATDTKSPRAFATLAITMTAVAIILAELVPAISNLEIRMSDHWLTLSNPATPNPQLVYLETDKVSYAADISDEAIAAADTNDLTVLLTLQGEFPWNREIWARLSEKLMDAGALGVVFNFTFASEKPDDPYFQSVISNHAPNVIVSGLIEQEAGLITLVQPSPSIVPTDHFGENIQRPEVGILNIHTDADGVVRRGLYRMDYLHLAKQALGPSMTEELGIRSKTLHTLAARAANLMNGNGQLPALSERPMIRFPGPAGTFPTVSLGRVMHPGTWDSEFGGGEYFRDKLIVVGPGAAVFENTHRTPVGEMSGTEIHLSYMNAVLNGDFVRPSGRLVNILMVGAAGLLGFLVALGIPRNLIRIVAGLLLSGAMAALLVLLAGQAGFLIQSFLVPVLLINSLTILRIKFPNQSKPSPPPSN